MDQRIQQLFAVMNGVVAGGGGAAAEGGGGVANHRRGLGVRTYAVIPVSPSCGLLGFVSGTRPLMVRGEVVTINKGPWDLGHALLLRGGC